LVAVPLPSGISTRSFCAFDRFSIFWASSYRGTHFVPFPVPGEHCVHLEKYMKKTILILGLSAGYSFAAPLDLQTAVSRVASNHPALSVAEAEVLSAQAEALQVGLWQNPVLGAEAENVLGSGGFSGGDSAEYTFSISQTFELGGKRSKRKQAALLRGEVAQWNLSGRRRALEQITIRAFCTALAAEARLTLAGKQVGMAQAVVEKAEQRVAAGRAHRLEISRAQLELADAELEAQNMFQALETAKTMLAALWGGTATEVEALEGNLEQVAAPVPARELMDRLDHHPAMLQAEAQIRQRQAEAGAADAERIPDVELGAGFRWLEESGDQAFVFGLSVPLAFGNRNQGGREAARIRTLQAEDELMAIRLGLQQELLVKSREVQAAYVQIASLKEKQLPTAKKAFEEATDGYEKGLFSSLDLLDALRGLFAQEVRYVNALLAYHQARAELENLVGTGEMKNEDFRMKNAGEEQ